MLQCIMASGLTSSLRVDLEDVLGNLQHARRSGDLGRLALLTYWDVRKWARWAHREALAQRASDLVTKRPHPSRSAFLNIVDEVIDELERIRVGLP
jgi:hypothetical protein